jgi:hypothetical protein
MAVPLTGAADAPDVPASPMVATADPIIKIVRIVISPFDRHRPQWAFADAWRAVLP